MYSYEIVHVPGKPGAMNIADIASRHPVSTPDVDTTKNLTEVAVLSFESKQGDNIQTFSWETTTQLRRS